MMIFPKLSWLVYVIQCLTCLAYDLREIKAPQGPLGVTLDYSLAIAFPKEIPATQSHERRTWTWSSHLTFNNPVSEISDGQLWKIAADAYAESKSHQTPRSSRATQNNGLTQPSTVDVDRVQYGIGKGQKPRAMAVLAWGNELILATSQKGGGSFSYDYGDTPVLRDLQLCQQVWQEATGNDLEHKNQGNCAEPMASHMYYSVHTAHLANRNARVATVVTSGNTLQQQDPCPGPHEEVLSNPFFEESTTL
jgi:hypothetical protein